ncbi:hypothetical protein PACTADRAFT_2437 [Pachysolen tannophilus NRRL Y-2460]|uniref:Gfo/Idh/MocA-like oxidoreductase N-terminal domain-containing protein n=1 Tax=Pachysolen tannophilus NRRL Y-2460 TaxID=669874 RepID=A0A1E4TWN0_PACTA|nr:hypothetical protein PACTADRAFT_2437 [Pachysolen tannophilus NRRL Y-2460]
MVYKVVIIGAGSNPALTSWASKSHIPALQALDKEYEIAGILNSSVESGIKARKLFKFSDQVKVYENIQQVADDVSIDLVVVTIKVAKHWKSTIPFLASGQKKIVYVEWPLGKDVEEAKKLSALAKQYNITTLVGLQSRFDPVISKVKDLITTGVIGNVTSVSFLASASEWGYFSSHADFYLSDVEKRARNTLLRIPGGHSLDAIRFVLGQEFTSVKARVDTKFKKVTIVDTTGKPTGEVIEKTTPDHINLVATLGKDILLSYSVSGGQTTPLTPGLEWHIRGTKGDIFVQGPSAFTQFIPLKMSYATTDSKGKINEFVPEYDGTVGNIQDLWKTFAENPDEDRENRLVDFEGAVTLHKVLEAIQQSSDTGKEIFL